MKVRYWEKAKKELSIKDDNLKKIINKSGNEYLTKSRDPFITLFNSILGQQISVSAATSIKKKITSKVKITAKDIERIPEEILKNCGLSRMKISYLKDLSSKIINKEISFKDLYKLDDNEVIKYLTSVKGIGDWTAEMFMICLLYTSDAADE